MAMRTQGLASELMDDGLSPMARGSLWTKMLLDVVMEHQKLRLKDVDGRLAPFAGSVRKPPALLSGS